MLRLFNFALFTPSHCNTAVLSDTPGAGDAIWGNAVSGEDFKSRETPEKGATRSDDPRISAGKKPDTGRTRGNEIRLNAPRSCAAYLQQPVAFSYSKFIRQPASAKERLIAK